LEAPFPYQTLYFRRPLLTDENKRLWSILIITSFITLIAHGFLVKWASEITSQQLEQNIKQDYIAYLAESYGQIDLIPSPTLSLFKEASIPKVTPRSSAGNSENRSVSSSNATKNTPSKPGNINREIAETSQMGIATIGSAVEGTPGYTGRIHTPTRREKRLSYRREVKIFRSHQDNILIPIPKIIQQASQNGNRDYYETIATMEANEIDIKYCFEKYARYDPSISGDVSLRFTIHPDGFVIPASVKITQSSIRDPRIVECIRKQIQRWRNFIPLAYEEGNFTVTRKYVF
jgi:hypothetical protein